MERLKCFLYNLATDKYRGFFPGILKFFLWAASLLYGLAVIVLYRLCRLGAYRLPCKVISVGNITLGGTGKTTLVELIAGYLKQQGHKVAVLSRGYKRPRGTENGGMSQEYSYEAMGDEPFMLQKKLKDVPVIVDPDRIRAARSAVKKFGVDTVILDDGFQQWKIRKDMEIVTVDAVAAFGNRHMLPRGVLREPLSSLKRAHLFVITRTDMNPEVRGMTDILKRLNPSVEIYETEHIPVGFYLMDRPDVLLSVDLLRGKKVILVSGIGSPASFEDSARKAGLTIENSLVFPDHYRYTTADVERIMSEAQEKNISTVLTTEKDCVRLTQITDVKPSNIQVWVLKIALRLKKDEQGFYNRLRGIYSA